MNTMDMLMSLFCGLIWGFGIGLKYLDAQVGLIAFALMFAMCIICVQLINIEKAIYATKQVHLQT